MFESVRASMGVIAFERVSETFERDSETTAEGRDSPSPVQP